MKDRDSNRGRNHGASLCFFLLIVLFSLLVLSGCESAQLKAKFPPRLLYLRGQALADQELYSDAIAKFTELAEQNPGSLLAAFSYLKIGELSEKLEKWVEAETNYRLFLTSSLNSDLTSYVLYRMMFVQHRKSFTGIIFTTREVDRDMEPNRKIMQEYKRFFFLYPNSIFMDQIREFYRDARETLAEYERGVADFYFGRNQFNAAANRYLYLLRNFPQYRKSEDALEMLIRSYRKNQQPDLADEMDRMKKLQFGKNGKEDASPAKSAAAAGDDRQVTRRQ